MMEFPWQKPAIALHSQRLLDSFHHWTGGRLLDVQGNALAISQALFDAPFFVLSHGAEVDPVLNYGNRKVLELWEMDWEELTRTPSRYTAEAIAREERARFLEQARQQGYISHYAGIRIAKTGKRFWIRDVIVWDVLDEGGDRLGQAATFDHWEPIASP